MDEDHIFVDNKQFVSLKRLGNAIREISEDMNIVVDKNKELAEENEALKILLKNQLNNN